MIPYCQLLFVPTNSIKEEIKLNYYTSVPLLYGQIRIPESYNTESYNTEKQAPQSHFA